MSKEQRFRRPSSATTASSGTDHTDTTSHSRNTSGGSSAAATATSAWTANDDDMLASARAAGMNWQPIATRFFPTKSANACRKRHERLMERRYQEEWEQDRLEELATAYFDCRKEMWAILGARLGERWTLVEGKCMEKGLKNLHTIARASHRKRARLSSPNGEHSYVPRSDPTGEADSGVGFDDVDFEFCVDNRPSSAPTSVGVKRSLSPSASPVRTRPRCAPRAPLSATDLPLYQPPLSAVSYTTRPDPTRFGPMSLTPVGEEGRPRSQPWGHRDILSIQSILSPAD